MDESATNATNEKQARLLTMALEVFRRKFVDSIAFQFANRDRKPDPPNWVRDSLPEPTIPKARDEAPIPLGKMPAPPAPIKASDTYQVGEAPIPLATPPQPAKPMPEPLGFKPGDEPAWNIKGGGFGLNTPKPTETTSATPAYDRPQSVIIVGPNPLPVKFDKALLGSATTPRAERESSGGGGGGGSSSSMAKAIAARFLAVLGPLYALSTVLNQTNSGMGVFQKAVSVMGATLAPILLPVFAILASALLSLSDFIWSKILPALGEFYDWVLKVLVPFAVKKGEAAESAVEGGQDLFRILSQSPSQTANDLKRNPGGTADNLAGLARQMDPTPMTGWMLDLVGKPSSIAKKVGGSPSAPAGGPPAKKDDTPSFGQRFTANMQDVLKSLAISMGPKASYSGLGDVGKQATLAAMNADPIEMKAAQRVVDSVKHFEAAVDRHMRREHPQQQIMRRDAERAPDHDRRPRGG